MRKNLIQELKPIQLEYEKAVMKLNTALATGNKTHAILFARWLLKHCYTTIDEDSNFCWNYKDKFYDTSDLYEIFTKEYNNTAIG